MSKGPGNKSPRGSARLWAVAKWSLMLLVFGFVLVRALQLWQDGSAGEIELRVGWLLLAGLLYTAGWVPSVWFWKTLLARMGDEVTWPTAFRAYYCGHLGKYVPGKALVPVIRGQLVSNAGGRFRVGAIAAVYETLLMMGVGAEVAVGLIPFLIPEDRSLLPEHLQSLATNGACRWVIENPWLLLGAVLLATAIFLPVVARLFAWVARKLAPADEGQPCSRPIDVRTIGLGCVAFCIAWMIHGLALWATLRGVGAEVSVSAIPVWTACVALPTVAGFLAIFSPGGVGVREGVLIEILQLRPAVDPRQAVATAFLLRLVGLLAEVVVAVVLYYGIAAGRTTIEPDTAGPPTAA